MKIITSIQEKKIITSRFSKSSLRKSLFIRVYQKEKNMRCCFVPEDWSRSTRHAAELLSFVGESEVAR